MEAQKEGRYISLPMASQHHALAALPRKETRYPPHRRQGGSRGRSARVWSRLDLFHPPELESQTVQPVAGRSIDSAIGAS
jgi:hypothetical protein